MNKYLQQVIIIGSVFLIILWFQIQDDKKYNKIRYGFYDIYKFPILTSAIIGLLLNFYSCDISDTDIFLEPKITNCKSIYENKYNLFEVDTGKFE
jgi:hypothetical protein